MRIASLLLLIVFQLSCVNFHGSSKSETNFFSNLREGRSREDFHKVSSDGMVASAHAESSRIGKEILLAGGNAVDAAIATSFAISVLRPQSTGIGGGGFMLVHNTDANITAYDFRERAPGRATRDMFVDGDGKALSFTYNGKAIPNASVNGHLAVGTPGLVAGLIHVHEKFGSLPLNVLLRGAIELARDGFVVYPDLADAIVERREVLLQFEDSRRLFLPGGQPLRVGEKLVQADLAWTLEQIAERGLAGFYDGPVCDRLMHEMALGRGILQREDLTNYRVKMRDALVGSYRGHRVVSMPPPSSGGVHVIEMLNMLSHFDVKSMGFSTVESIHLLAEVMKRAYADRAQYLGDPDFVAVPIERLISKSHASAWVKSITNQATPAEELARIEKERTESPSTTHISVVDKNGMAVSTTQTINYTFGSGVVARGTGIVLNDEMDDFSIKPGVPNVFGLVGSEANAVAANKTMLSSMSPTFVFDNNGKLLLVVGSPGGPRIINATLQTIVNVIDHDMSLLDAVHRMRIHHQWLPDVIRIESLSDETAEGLKARGHHLEKITSIGDVQAIKVQHTSSGMSFEGVSDTRSNGQPR